MDNLSDNDFLEYWNGLSLFSHDKKLMKGNFKNAKEYFSNYSLSKQPYLEKELLKYTKSILFIYGQQDSKYREYAQKYLTNYKVKYLSPCGHRVIQKKSLVLEEVKEFLCQ